MKINNRKAKFRPDQVTMCWIFGWLFLGLLGGCQTAPQQTSFAPIEARFESVPGGGAYYFVLINASGKKLHKFHFSAYMRNDNGWPEVMRGRPIYVFEGSGALWELGQINRFEDRRRPSLQMPIVDPVTRVDLVGHCEEGNFRQTWVVTEPGKLKAVGRE